MIPRSIRVISFDAGGTLLTPFPSVGSVYAAGARAVGLGECDPDELNSRFAAAWHRSDGFDYSRPAWSGLVADTFRGLVTDPESPELFRHLYDRFSQAAAWRIYSDVLPTLRGLRAAGFRLVVASNWDERLIPLFVALGLAPEFEWVAASAQVGFHKPDRRFFDAITRHLGISADAILQVGDQWREDVEGAQLAGWSAVYLSRRPKSSPGPNTIHSLTELLPEEEAD